MAHDSDLTGTVYLIHLARPVSDTRPAQHYLGYTSNFDQRMAAHRSGKGSAMLRAANARGIEWKVVMQFAAGRGGEVQLKRRRNHKRLCPVCTPKKSAR